MVLTATPPRRSQEGLAIEEACASGIPSKEAMFEAVKAEALIP
jgi:hypothetical protein